MLHRMVVGRGPESTRVGDFLSDFPRRPADRMLVWNVRVRRIPLITIRRARMNAEERNSAQRIRVHSFAAAPARALRPMAGNPPSGGGRITGWWLAGVVPFLIAAAPAKVPADD